VTEEGLGQSPPIIANLLKAASALSDRNSNVSIFSNGLPDGTLFCKPESFICGGRYENDCKHQLMNGYTVTTVKSQNALFYMCQLGYNVSRHRTVMDILGLMWLCPTCSKRSDFPTVLSDTVLEDVKKKVFNEYCKEKNLR
tara:strand:+ start:113 stop:535 length:423 start_codon:yes stop_codon:yes gene_type:complete